METFYRGPATLLTGAAEVPVVVALFLEPTGPKNTWSGSMHPEGAAPLWTELRGDNARLRLPDGHEGRILVLSSGFGSTVEVRGEGPPPF